MHYPGKNGGGPRGARHPRGWGRTWRFLLLAAALAVPAIPVAADGVPRPYAPAAPGVRVIYTGATLIDGRGGPAQAGMAIITDGERIVEVLPAANLDPARRAGAAIIDIDGAFVIPGLIDSHQHMATPPNRPRAEAQMRRDLFGGITAVRDMADDLRAVNEYARAARMGEIPGPDILAGAIFAGPDFFDDPRTAAAAEGVKPGSAPWMRAVDDDTDLAEAVTLARGTSAVAVKLYDNLRPQDVKRITAEAHRQGMMVWAHGMVFPTPPDAVVAAGVNSISHTCYLAYQISDPRPTTYKDRRPVEAAKLIGGDNPEMAKLFGEMATKGILLDATLWVYREYDRRLAANPDMKPRPHCSLDVAAALTAQALRAGVTVVAGTDGVPPAAHPWPALHDELELLHDRAGMSTAAVIRAATLDGARAMGQEAEMGSVEPGKLANFVVLDKDPLADLSNLRTLRFTVKRGARLDRTDYRPITAEEMP
ncbi:amidohydrolase family protein [Niveispirillum fermenti]|uniref:amidohydrolase family protein n=1 Tax=Niveispirillum fermenti TaxID=1233113 RepID=UPI003A8576BA